MLRLFNPVSVDQILVDLTAWSDTAGQAFVRNNLGQQVIT